MPRQFDDLDVTVEVVVQPLYPGSWPKNEADAVRYARDSANNVLRSIQRHVDNTHNARVNICRRYTCEFCGRLWTERDTSYNGGCCDRDEEMNPKGEKARDDQA